MWSPMPINQTVCESLDKRAGRGTVDRDSKSFPTKQESVSFQVGWD